MADRSRSRSPDRGAPPAEDQPEAAPADAPPAADAAAPAPADGGADNNNGTSGDEVKLYVGNLDYGTFLRGFLRGMVTPI